MNDVPIVGEPIAYGVGFIALLLVLLSRFIAKYPVTMAHEGGHMLANLSHSARQSSDWTIKDNADGRDHAAEVPATGST